ncbi:uncharacterized protein LOC126554859 [Aphis gossypii]|uniref:uncharacterized protein LOC126554859 n=1 Tax=Aphis gossypii TaxID=80765 RepID=UPI0021591655|nr:uncharacterized protein LOC126554859 [Aphis gossypii]
MKTKQVVHMGHHATVMDNPVAVITSDTVVEPMDHPKDVVTSDTEQQQHMWAKWNPEVLKNNKSAELMTPLATKKNIKTTLGDSVKKYSLKKLYLIRKIQYFENED